MPSYLQLHSHHPNGISLLEVVGPYNNLSARGPLPFAIVGVGVGAPATDYSAAPFKFYGLLSAAPPY